MNDNNKNQPEWPSSFGFGRSASRAEIDSLNIDVMPDGTGLPVGSGTAIEGRKIYAAKCSVCHGVNGSDGPYNKLVGKFNPHDTLRKERTIGNFWPYATTIYDYVQRSMPYTSPGSLSANEVYSITAFLLYKNELIDSTTLIDATSLPMIEMPAKKLFVVDDR